MKRARGRVWLWWELAWEFLRRNPQYRRWYASIQKTATRLLCAYYGQKLTAAQLARLRAGIVRAPVLCCETVIPILKRFGLKRERDCAVFDMLRGWAAHAQRTYWLYAPANPAREYRKWKTDVLDFFAPTSEMSPQTVAYHANPFLKHPHTITVTVNLRAPDHEIWPEIKRLVHEESRARKIVRPRKRRTKAEYRELLGIYDESESRRRADEPLFRVKVSDSKVRMKYQKRDHAKKLIEGGYKALLFGPSVLTTTS